MRLDIFAHSMRSIRAEAMDNFSDRSQFVIKFGWLGKRLKRNCAPQVRNKTRSGQRNSNDHIQLHVAEKSRERLRILLMQWACFLRKSRVWQLSRNAWVCKRFFVVGTPNQGTAARNNFDMERHEAHTHTSATHALKRSTRCSPGLCFSRGTN